LIDLWPYNRAAITPNELPPEISLITAVSEIICSQQPPTEAAVRCGGNTGAEEDLERITELALADLQNLHEGNVSRYRLRLSEYRAWQPLQNQ
jgi:hypothetical protein